MSKGFTESGNSETVIYIENRSTNSSVNIIIFEDKNESLTESLGDTNASSETFSKQKEIQKTNTKATKFELDWIHEVRKIVDIGKKGVILEVVKKIFDNF